MRVSARAWGGFSNLFVLNEWEGLFILNAPRIWVNSGYTRRRCATHCLFRSLFYSRIIEVKSPGNGFSARVPRFLVRSPLSLSILSTYPKVANPTAIFLFRLSPSSWLISLLFRLVRSGIYFTSTSRSIDDDRCPVLRDGIRARYLLQVSFRGFRT